MATLAVWCALDYRAASNIYAPRPGAGALDQRIAFGMKMPWWGYQADYALVNRPDEDEPSLPPQAFRRTVHNLLDARLMMAYARSLAEHGQVDKAQAAYAMATQKKDEEWDRIERQSPNSWQMRVATHITSENRAW